MKTTVEITHEQYTALYTTVNEAIRYSQRSEVMENRYSKNRADALKEALHNLKNCLERNTASLTMSVGCFNAVMKLSFDKVLTHRDLDALDELR